MYTVQAGIICAGILGRVIRRQNRLLELGRNQVPSIWNRVGHVPSMLIDFDLGSPPPPPENQFHDGIDSHKESIL
jgi:hypothetical protein